jgi:hypothetical protein
MTHDTKRVDELEAGDIVIFPYCKGVSTISEIEQVGEIRFKISSESVYEPCYYDGYTKVTYLGKKKEEEEIMKEQRVDCSALYPYFDSLANDEVNLKYTNIPTHVKQNLKLIHELFEGVLELTLEEVKTLYFERKMSKVITNLDSSLKNRDELKSQVLYNGYKLDVRVRLFIPNESYDLDKESVPDSCTTYCGSCEEIGFNVYLSTSTRRLVSRFKEAVDNYKSSKSNRTKKVSELKEGDIFQYGKSTSTVSRVENEPTFDSVRLYFFQIGNPATLPKNLEVVVLN